MRTALDFSPLYRSTVGFDRLFDLIDQTNRLEQAPSWPLYNVEKVGDDQYRITMAVAGFSPDEIERLRRNLGEQTRRGPALGSKFRQRAIRTARLGKAADCRRTSPAVFASCGSSQCRPGLLVRCKRT